MNSLHAWNVKTRLPVLLLSISIAASAHAQSAAEELEDSLRRDEQDHRYQDAEDLVSRTLVQRLADRAEAAMSLFSELEQATSVFDKRVQSLLTDDDGKRLAADTHAAIGFVRLFEIPIATVSEVRSHKSSVESILKGLRQELERDNVGLIPPDSLSNEINGHFFWAHERLARIREERNWVEATVRRAPRDIDLAKAPTLKQSMDIFMVNRIDAWTRGRLEGMADAAGESKEIIKVNTRLIELEKSNAEANRMWREAVAEIERMKIDTEIRIKQETAAERERLSLARIAYENKLADLQQKEKDAEAARKADEMKAQLARDKQLEEAEKPVLIKRCQEPETRTTLAPFLDKGMVRPSGNRGTRYYDTIEPVPVSLKDLYACGALDETPEGLDKLYWATIDPQDTMRTRWRRSQQWRTTPALREKLVKAQKLLIELGPTLVELEMLQE